MKRINRRKLRIDLTLHGYKDGKRILSTTYHIPAAFYRRIEASPATEFKVRVYYGRAKTNAGRVEDIVNEVVGTKSQVLKTTKVFLSASELDFTQRYWEFV